MMMDRSKLVCNLVPIYVEDVQIPVSYSGTESDGCARSKKRHEDEFPELKLNDDVWWSFDEFPGCNHFEIGPENKRLFAIYLQSKLSEHFQNQNYIHSNNFIGGISVWIPNDDLNIDGFSGYQKYCIKVQHDKNQYLGSKGLWCLQLTYEGGTLISNQTVEQAGIEHELLSKVIKDRVITKKTRLETDDVNSSAFILNRDIRNHLMLPSTPKRIKNRYLDYYNHINSFYMEHIKQISIENLFYVKDSGFINVRDSQVRELNTSGNLLEFKDGNTHFSNYQGLKKYGPVSGPNPSEVKLIFIFHETDKDSANTLYQYLKKGLKGFPGLDSFVNVPVNLDVDNSIKIPEQQNEVDYVKQEIEKLNISEEESYFAFYLTRVDKENAEEATKENYYHIKSMLMEKGIISQVIYKDNISRPAFNFFLPNIAIAVLAKLNGIPWRLSRPIQQDLVVGIGAYKPIKGNVFLGTTITFLNDGSFHEFSSIESTSLDDLTNFFKSCISNAIEAKSDFKRVVIHFYKQMNHKEENALTRAIQDLKLNIPYVVLHITEEAGNSYVVFDEDYPAKMPVSGLAISIKRGLYLLTNNQRYKVDAGMKIDDFPLPLRVSVSKNSDAALDESEIDALLDQIVQFSRMYWVGIKQKSLPVTILYSQKLARFKERCPDMIFPNNEKSKNTLWFL